MLSLALRDDQHGCEQQQKWKIGAHRLSFAAAPFSVVPPTTDACGAILSQLTRQWAYVRMQG
jgi:hypothetical protein